MADSFGAAMLVLVAVLLGVGLVRQFAVSGPRWLLLDHLGIVPQWKFFGQNAIATDPAWFDDFHLLARRARSDGTPGSWHELLWSDERRPGAMLWNPGLRCHDQLIDELDRLARHPGAPPTSLAYLAVLRLSLDRLPPGEGDALQFAVAATRGRGERGVELRFVSSWHTA